MEEYSSNKEQAVEIAHQQVLHALELLNRDTVQDYNEAVEQVPILVQTESKIIDFLRTEDFNPFTAATRLARYWQTRRVFFGEDRWLRPLNQTGSGALDSADIALLRTGYFFMLTKDASRPMIIVDFSRLPQGTEYAQGKLLFYSLSTSTCEALQTTGLTVLHVINGGSRSLIMPRPDVAEKILSSLPFRMKRVLIAKTYEEGKEHLLNYRLFAQHQVSSVHHNGHKHLLDCIVADSLQDTINALEKEGLSRSCIPLELGGDLHLTNEIEEWIRACITMEDIMAAAPTSLLARSSVSRAKSEGPLIRQQPNESREEFVRRRNTFYGRRMAERERQEIQHLESQQQCLSFRNEALRRDNRRLEEGLAQARHVVALLTQSTATAPPARLKDY